MSMLSASKKKATCLVCTGRIKCADWKHFYLGGCNPDRQGQCPGPSPYRADRQKGPAFRNSECIVDRYFDVNEVGIFMRTTPYYAPDSRVTGDSGRRKPPNPPKPTKCQGGKDFTKQGPTGYTIRKTCLDCGHSMTEKRQEEPTYPVGECPHKDVDYWGSSGTTHRVYCKQCCTYIGEAPMQVFKERTTIAKKVETAQVNKVPVIESIVDEEFQILTPGQLDKILPQSASVRF